MKVVQSFASGREDAALDATDKEVEGVWKTLDSQPLNYTNFWKEVNHTNTEFNYAQLCASLGCVPSPGTWNDVEWSVSTDVICEKDAQVTTAKST